MENSNEETPMDQLNNDVNQEKDEISTEPPVATISEENQLIMFKGKTPDHTTKEPYKAKFTFYPDRPVPSWSDKSIPINNVSRRKFELECNNLQTKSREDLAKRRKDERNQRKTKNREESMKDLSTNEMFERLMDKLDARSDAIEDKLSVQETKMTEMEKTMHDKFNTMEEEK